MEHLQYSWDTPRHRWAHTLRETTLIRKRVEIRRIWEVEWLPMIPDSGNQANRQEITKEVNRLLEKADQVEEERWMREGTLPSREPHRKARAAIQT
jgi:hypothetical protein